MALSTYRKLDFESVKKGLLKRISGDRYYRNGRTTSGLRR